jgi:hypothetical protein
MGKNTPNEIQSIGENFECVKSHSQQAEENFCRKLGFGIGPAWAPEGGVLGKIQAKNQLGQDSPWVCRISSNLSIA